MSKEKIADKIAKLLRLATSPVEAEAQAALTKAQELSAKYGVELKIKENEEAVFEISLDSKNTGLSLTERQIATKLAKYFRVTTYLAVLGKHKTIKVCGFKDDTETFAVVYLYTLNIFEKLWRVWWAKNKENYALKSAPFVRNTYLLGFLSGTEERFDTNIQEHSLVVYVPNAVVKYTEEKKLTKSKPSTIVYEADSKAYMQGYRDGKELTDKTKQVN